MTLPSPSAPTHLLRYHLAAVNALHFSEDNERLCSGDASGTVIVTSTRSLRPLARWKAHEEGLLGVEEWEGQIITHGRDNKLHVWELAQEPATKVGDSAVAPELPTPKLCYSMDVNALNYCRFSLMPLHDESGTGPLALIALPNLVESSLADIWELPSQRRIHAAIGKAGQPISSDGRSANPTGIIMSMHLYQYAHPNVSARSQLRLLCAYESGDVTMWGYINSSRQTSIEGIGWEKLWSVKLHVESIMAMAISKDRRVALSVSADHLVGRYDLLAAEDAENVQSSCTVHRTKHPGNGSIAIRDDGRVCAIGGWDGKIRLYSTKKLKTLGTLDHHRKSSLAVAFARSSQISSDLDSAGRTGEDDEDEMTNREKEERGRWLAAGSEDSRVSIWQLISFEKP